jgi:predicted molibdopterin-dependent oxidoreductase YjgC
VVVVGTTVPAWAATKATVVLPVANMAEEEGTFTNLRGRVQRFTQAKAAPGFARPTWWVLCDLLTAVGEKTNYFIASDVFAALAKDVAPFAGMSYDALGLKGREIAGGRAGART